MEEVYKYSLQIVDTIKDPLLVLNEDRLERHACGKDRLRCLEAGMDAVVTKPIDRDELFAVFRGFLET